MQDSKQEAATTTIHWQRGSWKARGVGGGLFAWLVVTCQVVRPLALRYSAVVCEHFIILINAALEQCTISMLRGMRRTLTNEKRRSRRGRGTRRARGEREWANRGMWMWNTARRVTSSQKDLPMWGKGCKYANFQRRMDLLAWYVLRSDWVFCGTHLLLPRKQYFTFGLEAAHKVCKI